MSFVDVRDHFDALNHGDDWTLAFTNAISAAQSGGYGGVLVPASLSPYTIRKPPAGQRPSIDLRGVQGFTLLGEGERSVIAMIGPGSWRLIHIGGQATGVEVRDISLTGIGLEDADQQSHLIVIGTSNLKPGGARDVTIARCTLQHAAGDAVAIVPRSSTEQSEVVADIRIEHCRMLHNGRSGVSNQRLGKRISILHNHFEGNADQDIDFEPTGNLSESGPSDYLILGNRMVRSIGGTSVTLSGTSPDSPSRRNTFAYNHIHGGNLGLHNAHDIAIVGNYIEIGAQPETVLRMGGSVERLLLADNIAVRPSNAPPGTLLNVSSEASTWRFAAVSDVDVAADTLQSAAHGLRTGIGPLRAAALPTPESPAVLPSGLAADVDYWAIRVDDDLIRLAASHQRAEAGQFIDLLDSGLGRFALTRTDFPRAVSVRGNHLITHVPSPIGEALITFTNASSVSFSDNEVTSFAGVEVPIAVKFDTTPARKRPLAGWEVVGNRFRGDARLVPEFDEPALGRFGVAVSMAPRRPDTVRDVRISGNTFAGCDTQLRLQAHSSGAFTTPPVVVGNMGVGASLAFEGAVPTVLVGGNEQPAGPADPVPAGARFCGAGAPAFAAPIGSLYSRSDGSAAQLLYINTDGANTWTTIA